MASAPAVILMTDFGTEHWHSAVMKGEILRRADKAHILDLSHDVMRQSVKQGAFMLHCAMDSFPKQSIFCCVIDPGVGSERRTLVGWAGEYGFVGPDNGLVTPLLDRANGRFELHEIKSPIFCNPVVSATFHGRDVFAPAAAKLVLGADPRLAGPRVTDPVVLPSNSAKKTKDTLTGEIMLIDHFGNAVTSIHRSDFEGDFGKRPFELKAKSLRLSKLDKIYSERPRGEPVCHWGSSDYLEIAVNYGSAAEQFGLRFEDEVTITFKS